jgi:DNA-binding NarL/FixJ family response regulator
MALEGHGFTVCAAVASAPDAIQAAIQKRPNVCLIETRLPGGGTAAAETIATETPNAAIVMLSSSPSHDELLACVRAGARGYLPKGIDPERLPVALRGVLAGESAVPRALILGVFEELRASESGRHARELSRLGVELTLRQRQTLELLDAGFDTAEIGDRLGLSAVTVRRHISGVLRKLNVSDREGALKLLRAAREQP